MAKVSIQIQVDGLDGMIDAMRSMRRGGPAEARTRARLDAAMHTISEASRGLAHEHQGDLKSLMRSAVDHSTPGWWSGSVYYGARGAAFEVQRGGDHSQFVDGLTEIAEPLIEDALDELFRDL